MIPYIIQFVLMIIAHKKSNWGWMVIIPIVSTFALSILIGTLTAIVASIMIHHGNTNVVQESNVIWVAIGVELLIHAGAITAYVQMIRHPRAQKEVANARTSQ